jgi:ketosteroid isomerase-like protein
MKGTIALLLLSLAGTVPAAAQDSADSVASVLRAFARNSEEKNVAALDSLVAPDAWVRIIEGAGVNEGWADYRDHHLVPELAEFENFRYRFFAIEPQVRGAVAWAPFQYDLAADTPRGHVEVEGRGTAVFERRDGRWVLVHLHTSGRRKPAN